MFAGRQASAAKPDRSFARRFRTGLIGIACVAVAMTTSAVVTPAASAAIPAGASPTLAAGGFPVTIVNKASADYASNRVYVTVMGQATPGQWSYVDAQGGVHHIDHDMANAPDHLTKDGVNYPNMSFSLDQADQLRMPDELQGARIYLSLGSPMYLSVAPDDTGWAGPDLNNPNDPNRDVLFDWYEFTYKQGAVAFGGNTTQVDMMGFPITARLQQTDSKTDITTGIDKTRAQVVDAFTKATPAAFASSITPERIIAPRTSSTFSATGANAHYLQGMINAAWAEWKVKGFSLTRLGQTFQGKVNRAGNLVFNKDGQGTFTLHKPSTQDVFACAGALASKGMNDTELELGAEVCAAFNRGVEMNTTHWYTPSDYYQNTLNNSYAKVMHEVSINGKAYGFAYDDVNSQSSVAILPNTQAPSMLTLTIQPMK